MAGKRAFLSDKAQLCPLSNIELKIEKSPVSNVPSKISRVLSVLMIQ
jgi:hypothetical protein